MMRYEIEATLDRRMLQGQNWKNGKWYDLRRNGATKLWKTRPNDYSIPVKAGLRDAFRIEHDCSITLRVRPDNFDARIRA